MGLAMGAYLSQPKTDKESSDEIGKYVKCGASSMQGWRETQEDAHNCIIEYDENTGFFAVYDGHGGHEVAQYCALNLPNYLKNNEAYKKQEFSKALQEAFLGFDATLTKPEIVAILKRIAKEKGPNEEDNQDSESEDEENIQNLYEEAQMPLEEVIAKYQPDLQNLRQKKAKGSESSPQSSKNILTEAGCSSQASSSSSISDSGFCGDSNSSILSTGSGNSSGSSSSSCGSSGTSDSNNSINDSNEVRNDSCLKINEECKKEKHDNEAENISSVSNGESESLNEKTANKIKSKLEIKNVTDIKKDSEKDEDCKETEVAENIKKNGKNTKNHGLNGNDSKDEEITEPHENGDVANEETENEEEVEDKKTEEKENGGTRKSSRKGKMISKQFAHELTTQGHNMALLYLLAGQDVSDSESDDADESFQDGEESSSNDEDGTGEGETELAKEGSWDEEDEDEEDEDDEEEEEDGCYLKNKPGVESGCTAVVALLHGRDLYVANAGDSRCVVCRNGEALDMSLDHKPEDRVELQRIVDAGGYVSRDGRVVGGLNLSRAIGDHSYKKSGNLPPEKQMITALPDVRTLSLDPEHDEFMILACDGIWNFMTSQKVVDFVRTRLEDKDKKLSTICEELFDHCLADNTLGDGTGCDNMTAVLIQFLPSLSTASSSDLPNTSCNNCASDEEDEKNVKRPASPHENLEEDVKRIKTEEVV